MKTLIRNLIGIAMLFGVIALSAGPADGAGRTVRVGMYQNEPKIFTDENGHAAGFFIELLDEIAKEEGWISPSPWNSPRSKPSAVGRRLN